MVNLKSYTASEYGHFVFFEAFIMPLGKGQIDVTDSQDVTRGSLDLECPITISSYPFLVLQIFDYCKWKRCP